MSSRQTYPCCEGVQRVEAIPGAAGTLLGGYCPVHGVSYNFSEEQDEPLIQFGEYSLNSGLTSDYKLVADAFIRANIKGLPKLISRMVGPFGSVYGVSRGGLKLAERLKPLVFNGTLGGHLVPHLIVDDVLTTGRSLQRAFDAHKSQWPGGEPNPLNRPPAIIGCVVFARGRCPPWVKSLFQMPSEFWPKGNRA